MGTSGQSFQPSTAGTYNAVCCDSSGFPIFLHESSGLYMYYNSGWFISDRIQGDYKLFGYIASPPPSTNCPDDSGIVAWLVRTGPDAQTDLQQDADITVSSV